MRKILKQVAFMFILFYLMVFITFELNIITYKIVQSTLYSGSINLMNIIVSIVAFNYGYDQSNKKFLIYVFGTMVLRMFFILICVFIVVKFINIDQYGFIFSLFILYFVALMLEINFYRLKIKEKKN
jgi:hypothetical protein